MIEGKYGLDDFTSSYTDEEIEGVFDRFRRCGYIVSKLKADMNNPINPYTFWEQHNAGTRSIVRSVEPEIPYWRIEKDLWLQFAIRFVSGWLEYVADYKALTAN